MRNILKLTGLALLTLLVSCGQSNGQKEGQNGGKLPAAEFAAKVEGKTVQLVDVRTAQEFESGFIAGAKNIDYYSENFIGQFSAMAKDQPLYIYCKSGGRSEDAAAKLREAGFKQVYELEGGIMAWNNAGLKLAGRETAANAEPGSFDQAISGSKLVLVDFFATWCGPCKMMAPDIEALKNERAADVTVMSVDTDQYQELAARYTIEVLPTLVLYKNGKELHRVTGLQSRTELDNLVNQYK